MPAQLTIAPNPNDWQRGSPNALVVILEYGDFQCPDCGASFPELKQVYESYPEEVLFIYRHLPLTDIHEYALLAAQAAEAAGAQGKFWEMHDQLYDNQADLTREDLIDYARLIELDVDEFTEALDSNRYLDEVRADLDGARRGGITSTPTVFVNGELLNEEVDAESLISLLEHEMGEE